MLGKYISVERETLTLSFITVIKSHNSPIMALAVIYSLTLISVALKGA